MHAFLLPFAFPMHMQDEKHMQDERGPMWRNTCKYMLASFYYYDGPAHVCLVCAHRINLRHLCLIHAKIRGLCCKNACIHAYIHLQASKLQGPHDIFHLRLSFYAQTLTVTMTWLNSLAKALSQDKKWEWQRPLLTSNESSVGLTNVFPLQGMSPWRACRPMCI